MENSCPQMPGRIDTLECVFQHHHFVLLHTPRASIYVVESDTPVLKKQHRYSFITCHDLGHNKQAQGICDRRTGRSP